MASEPTLASIRREIDSIDDSIHDLIQRRTGLVESIRGLLARGEKEGVFRPGVDPIQLYISISALTYHFFSNQRTFSVIFGKDFSGPDMLRLRLEHVLDVVVGYLRFKPGT